MVELPSDYHRRELRLQTYTKWKEAYYLLFRLQRDRPDLPLSSLASWPECVESLERDGETVLNAVAKTLETLRILAGEQKTRPRRKGP